MAPTATRLLNLCRNSSFGAFVGALVFASGIAAARDEAKSAETQLRSRIAAANLEDAIVVDCQLPGKLQKLGGIRTYLTPGLLTRLPAVDCRARGGEYTLGDLSSGTLSLQRWLPLAQQGQAEAQYYVARIYANGMSGVTADYAQAAQWYQRAAEQNYAAASQELGYLYEQGLGVDKNALTALNLQRKAAGLGEELDYAWKITAAEEDAARQIAALTEQLNASNAELVSLRESFETTNDAAFKARAELARAESALLDLREQLQAAKTGAPTQRVAELQQALAARESQLQQAQARVEQLNAQLVEQQARVAARTAESQTSNAELNELLAAAQAKNRSLEAQLAQGEARLISTQQELTSLRTQYRADVDKLAAEQQDLERATSSKDEVEALVYARERELARQLLRVTSLEQELNKLKRATASTAAPRAADDKQMLQARLTQLQTRYTEQQQQLKKQQEELRALQSKAATDRATLTRDMNEQLARRAAALDETQRRIASMQAQADALRAENARLTQQRDRDVNHADEAAASRQALRFAQSQLAEQRERLDRLQTERASETAALLKARDELRRQASADRQRNEAQLELLKKRLDAREKDLGAKDQQIARLERELAEQSDQYTRMLSQLPPKPATSVAKLRSVSRPETRSPSPTIAANGLGGTHYHALLIANSHYANLPALATPANDAREIKELLETSYGFKVTVLLDQTREQIMRSLHELTLTLGPQDSLLIYYAGHGDADAARSRAYWLGVEADPVTRSGWLEADHVRAKVKDMQAKHVLLVADSCFSGAITHPKTTTIGRGLNETRLRIQWNRRARMVLTSGEVTPVVDSASDPNHSLFARHLIQILRQNLNVMSGEMLAHELAARMLAESVKVGEKGQRQTPTYAVLQDANHDVGDFFFTPIPAQVKVAGLD